MNLTVIKAPTTPISPQKVVHMESNSNVEQPFTFNERLPGGVAAQDALIRSDGNLTQTAFNAPTSGGESVFHNADATTYETLLEHLMQRPRSSQTIDKEPHQYASSLSQQDSKHYEDGDGALTLGMKLCESTAALNLQSLSTADPLPSYDPESTNLRKTSSTIVYPSLTSTAWDCTDKSRPVCDGVNQPLYTPPRTPVDGNALYKSLGYPYDTPQSRRTNVQRQNVPFAVRYIPIIRSCQILQPPLASWRVRKQEILPVWSGCCEGLPIDPHVT